MKSKVSQRFQRGQALLEYVLLVSIAVVISVGLFRLMASEDSGLRKAWVQILCQIGADNPNSSKNPPVKGCP